MDSEICFSGMIEFDKPITDIVAKLPRTFACGINDKKTQLHILCYSDLKTFEDWFVFVIKQVIEPTGVIANGNIEFPCGRFDVDNNIIRVYEIKHVEIIKCLRRYEDSNAEDGDEFDSVREL